jgi:hypothetical protein
MDLKKFIRLFGINLYPKDFYYDDINSRYGDLSGYNTILKFMDESPIINTETGYVFTNGELPKLNIVLRSNQLTVTEYSHPEVKNLKIYLFRDLIIGLKVRKEMHSFGKDIFLIKYSFPYISKSQKENLRCKALSKYVQTAHQVFESVQIKCSDNYSVFINDSVEFEIYHINNSSEFFIYYKKQLTKKLSDKRKLLEVFSENPAYI